MGQYWILRSGICRLSAERLSRDESLLVGLVLIFDDVTDNTDTVEERERELERGETPLLDALSVPSHFLSGSILTGCGGLVGRSACRGAKSQ